MNHNSEEKRQVKTLERERLDLSHLVKADPAGLRTVGTSARGQGRGASNMLQWTPEGTVISLLVPSDRGMEPRRDPVPSGPSVEERLAEIARRVQAVAQYPPTARARAVSGETLVELRVGPDGTPQQVRTRRSSGSVALDRAAERAVHDAAPLPRVIGSVTVPVRFQLTAD